MLVCSSLYNIYYYCLIVWPTKLYDQALQDKVYVQHKTKISEKLKIMLYFFYAINYFAVVFGSEFLIKIENKMYIYILINIVANYITILL